MLKTTEFPTKIDTSSVTKEKICIQKDEEYEETYFLSPDFAIDVLVCCPYLRL